MFWVTLLSLMGFRLFNTLIDATFSIDYLFALNSVKSQISLIEMGIGKKGVVVEIDERKGLISRLSTLGIRPGVEIKKLSAQAMRGPTVINVGKSHVAIGFDMAKRILVEVDKEKPQKNLQILSKSSQAIF